MGGEHRPDIAGQKFGPVETDRTLDPKTTSSRFTGAFADISNLAADGKIFIVGREGIALVVQAGKEFKILGTSDLKDVTYASPAIAGDRLYIRTWKHLYCIGAK